MNFKLEGKRADLKKIFIFLLAAVGSAGQDYCDGPLLNRQGECGCAFHNRGYY